jgi:hypothetical protein
VSTGPARRTLPCTVVAGQPWRFRAASASAGPMLRLAGHPLPQPVPGPFQEVFTLVDEGLTTCGNEHQAAKQWRPPPRGSQGKAAATPPDVEAPASAVRPFGLRAGTDRVAVRQVRRYSVPRDPDGDERVGRGAGVVTDHHFLRVLVLRSRGRRPC